MLSSGTNQNPLISLKVLDDSAGIGGGEVAGCTHPILAQKEEIGLTRSCYTPLVDSDLLPMIESKKKGSKEKTSNQSIVRVKIDE